MKLATVRLVALAIFFAAASAAAEDVLKLAIGQRGNWENAAPELGQKAGFFKKRGLTLELLYTQGAGETMQAVISGSVDLGIGVGHRRRARRLCQGRAGSRHRQLDDRRRRPVLVRAGGIADQEHQGRGGKDHRLLDHGVVDQPRGPRLHPRIRRAGEAGRDRKPGVDVHADDVGSGRHRLVVSAVRRRGPAAGTHSPDRARKRCARLSQPDGPADDRQHGRPPSSDAMSLDRYLQAYRETLDWMYSDPAALKAYAEWVNIPETLAKEVRDQFYPKDNLRLDRLSGLDEAMADAVSMKFLAAPLTKQQQDDLFKYYARGSK